MRRKEKEIGERERRRGKYKEIGRGRMWNGEKEGRSKEGEWRRKLGSEKKELGKREGREIRNGKLTPLP